MNNKYEVENFSTRLFSALSYMATGGDIAQATSSAFPLPPVFFGRSLPQLPLFGLVRGFFHCDPDAALIGDNCRVRRHTNGVRGRLLVLLPEQHETPAAINERVVLEAQHATPVTINKHVVFNVDVIVSIVAAAVAEDPNGCRPAVHSIQPEEISVMRVAE